MQVEHHDLHHEFPEFARVIQSLKLSSHRFSRLLGDYEALTVQIEQLEAQDVPVDDFTIESMKKKRVKQKDELYAMLVAQQQSKVAGK